MIVLDRSNWPVDPVTGRPDNSIVRAWAWRNGHNIAEYGPIPWAVVRAFQQAHQSRIDRAQPVTVRFI